MPLLTLSGVRKSYGAEVILEHLDLVLHEGDRVGVVGPNGAGKTTLFKLILGEEDLDAGSIHRAQDLTVGYLPQVPDLDPERTALEEALAARSDLKAVEARLRALEDAMARAEDPDALERLVREHGRLHEDFEHGGGYNVEARAAAVLAGLGLDLALHRQKAGTLSGGEKARVALARLLLRAPDLLLLDEPTNHIDLEGAEWLEEYLTTSPRALLVISHDRWFLDRVATRTLALGSGGEKVYPGAYSKFETLRAEELKALAAEVEKQQDFIRKERAFIRKHMGSQRSREAKGRLKRLRRLEVLSLPPGERGELRLDLSPARRAGNEPLVVEGLTVGYPGRPLVRGLTYRLETGERLGIVGRNGAGKSTLLRALAGRERPLAGTVRHSQNADVAFFDQELAGLSESLTVYATIHDANVQWTDLEVRSFLARLLFFEEDVDRPVALLSGGERARLLLGLLLLRRPNLLFLDEPTNHLDIPARQALEQLLDDYTGTVIAVSHDRWFLDRIATRILWLGEDGARLYTGRYSDALAARRRAAAEARRLAEEAKPKAARPSRAGPAPRPPKARKLETVEAEIMAREDEKARILAALASPEVYADGARVKALKEQLDAVHSALAALEAEWDALT